MIEPPNDIELFYDNDLASYKNLIDELKRKAIIAKNILFSEQFEPYPENGSNDDKIDFLLQFIDFIGDLALFPDDGVIKKLKELRFASQSLKWFVKLEDILKEIERLKDVKGVVFSSNLYLYSIATHLYIKLIINTIEGFGLNTTYNNAETNILNKDFAERYRRREYNDKKKQTAKMDFFERMINKMLDNFEKAFSSEVSSKQLMLQYSKGNTSTCLTSLNIFNNNGISRSKFYIELFPLIKMILKDSKFLSEEDYFAKKDDKYSAKYSNYKLARVKRIFQKK